MEPVWQISRGKTTFFSTLSWQWLMATHLKSLVCAVRRVAVVGGKFHILDYLVFQADYLAPGIF